MLSPSTEATKAAITTARIGNSPRAAAAEAAISALSPGQRRAEGLEGDGEEERGDAVVGEQRLEGMDESGHVRLGCQRLAGRSELPLTHPGNAREGRR